MEQLHALIVDDEPPARRRLRAMLAGEPGVSVVDECGTVAEAARQLRALDRVDVVFLDVQLPEQDGFGLTDELAWGAFDHEPAVVFVTAHAEHAARAFDVRAVDYLLKPFSPERLAEALDRVREVAAAGAARRASRQRLPVDLGGRIRLLELDQVEYLRSEGNYVRVHTTTGAHLVRGSLSALGTRLPADRFCRVHRSLIVRLECVREVAVLAHGELALHLRSGATLISGRSYRERVRAALGL